MVQRPFPLLLAAALACGATGCDKATPAQTAAQEQLEFQKAQRLKLIKVYDDLAKKFPESPNAPKAAERAAALRLQAGVQAATPAKK
jgi:hypothetical protein